VPDAKTVEDILDWAEECISRHHLREEYQDCLAIAQEFDEWFTTKNGEDYHIYYFPS